MFKILYLIPLDPIIWIMLDKPGRIRKTFFYTISHFFMLFLMYTPLLLTGINVAIKVMDRVMRTFCNISHKQY